jgi:RecA-family ATPase
VIVAEPKVGKSWLAADLAICLALGVDFLGRKVPRAVKVAFVSREDNPSLTRWRLASERIANAYAARAAAMTGMVN